MIERMKGAPGRAFGPRPGSGKLLAILPVFAVLLWVQACAGCSDREEAVAPATPAPAENGVYLEMGGEKVFLEVADTDQKRALGLMNRKHMDQDKGMLFVYHEPKLMKFYMRNTLIPLSIAFVREDGTILNIEDMRPMTESPSHYSRGLCRFAIEMNQGWFRRRGIEAGQKIALTEEILSIPAQ